MGNFGRFQLVRQVGRGGMAEIWKARIAGPKGFEKTIALKMVLQELADESDFVSMLIDEAKLVASLAHPNIVQVHDFGVIDGRYFVAMEYVPGANLASLVARLVTDGMPVPRNVALYVGLCCARALGYAHAKTDAAGTSLKIVHRDVSPQNVLVSFDGDVKLGDFGIAKAANAIARTEHGRVRGKVAWMSPEQARSEPLDGRSDLFALGLVVYLMLFGRKLFTGQPTEMFRKVTVFPGPLETEIASLPVAERHLLRMALAGSRESRFPDGSAMEDAIAAALQAHGGEKPARARLAELVRERFTGELAREREEATGSGEIANPDPGPITSPAPAAGAAIAPESPPVVTALTPSSEAREPAVRTEKAVPRRRVLVAGVGAAVVAGAGLGSWALSGNGKGPRRGGALRVAMTMSDDSFDPFTTADTRARHVLGLVCDTIIATDPDDRHPSGVVGATRMRDDGRHVEMTLRPGVWFHDHPCFSDGKGRAATADDVAFSITLALRMGGLSLPITGAQAMAKTAGARPSGLVAIAPDTIAIDFDSPSAFYEVELSGVLLFPRELETFEPNLRALRQPVGTGPFRFTGAPRLDRMVLDRSPRCWLRDDDGRALPYLDRLEILTGGDYLSLIGGIRNGEYDVAVPRAAEIPRFVVMGGARPRLVDELKDAGVELGVAISQNGYRLFGLFVMRRPGPLADARVRRAVALAIDRVTIAKASSFDAPAARFLRDDQVGYDPTIEDLRYDLVEARALLAEAGHPDARGFEELVIAKFDHPPADDLVVDALRALGFRVRVVPVTGASFGKLVQDRAADGVLSMYSYMISGTEVPDMATMYKGWGESDATMDAFARQLVAAVARSERAPIYGKLERALLTELPMIPVGWGKRGEPISAMLVRPGVEGLIDPGTGQILGSFVRAWISRPPRQKR